VDLPAPHFQYLHLLNVIFVARVKSVFLSIGKANTAPVAEKHFLDEMITQLGAL
jgi:hypothetical protein